MDDLVKTARRAEGSDLLPKVSFGVMNAEVLILRMADRIEELVAERDEALNQLDSARHSVEVLEANVARMRDALKICRYRSEPLQHTDTQEDAARDMRHINSAARAALKGENQ